MTMPTPSPTAFPAFPSLYTEQDAARLADLKAQQVKMQELQQTKFSAEAWAKVNPVEQQVRELAANTGVPSQLTHITPVEWGLSIATPEQFMQESASLDKEMAELTRRQRVTQILPSVMNTIRALALTEDGLITDRSMLESTFQLSKEGFAEDEIVYLDNFARRVANASPEDIASGEILNAQPLSPEDIAEYARTSAEPRHVLATISFSQNIGDLTSALQGMYKPQNAKTTAVQDIIAKYKQDTQGTTPESAKVAAAVIAEEGKPLILTLGTERAEARIKSDNTVWDIKGNVIGYKLPDSDKVYGFNLKGQPTLTIEAERNVAADLGLAFVKSLAQMGIGTRQAQYEVFPNMLLTTFQDYLKESSKMVVGTEEMKLSDARAKEVVSQQVQQWKDWLRASAKKNQDYYNWAIQDNPVFLPPLNWEEPYTFELSEIVHDPGRMAYSIVSNAPVMIIGALIGIQTTAAALPATTALTGNPVTGLTLAAGVGAIATFMTLTPMQMAEIHDEYLANGGNEDDADKWGVLAGAALGLTEVIPDIVFAKTVTPAFMRVFKSNLLKGITKEVAKRAVASAGGAAIRAGWDGIRQIGMEVVEEMLSTLITNATIQTVNDKRGLLDNMENTIVSTAISTLLSGGITAASSYSNIRNNFTGITKSTSDHIFGEYIEKGLPEDLANKATIARIMETGEGEIAAEEAVKTVDAKSPTTVEEQATKQQSISDRIKRTSMDLENLRRNASATAKNRWVDRLETLKKKLVDGDPKVSQADVDAMDAKIHQATNVDIPALEQELVRLNKVMKETVQAQPVAQTPPVQAPNYKRNLEYDTALYEEKAKALAELKVKGVPDIAYKTLISTFTRTVLKKGETWQSVVEGYVAQLKKYVDEATAERQTPVQSVEAQPVQEGTTLEEQIRSAYTPEKATAAREALTSLMSGAYNQLIARSGKIDEEIRALKSADFDTSQFNLPVGKLVTKEQFSHIVATANLFLRALNKVESTVQEDTTPSPYSPPSPEELRTIAKERSMGYYRNVSEPFTGEVYQGKGASLESIYGEQAIKEGRAVPLFGAGNYYAFTEPDAALFGENVTKHTVTLKNGFILDTDEKWRKLLKDADTPHLDNMGKLFTTEPEGIAPDTVKLQKYLVSKGYDGVLVYLQEDDSSKRLRSMAGTSQVVVFGTPSPTEQVSQSTYEQQSRSIQIDYNIELSELDSRLSSAKYTKEATDQYYADKAALDAKYAQLRADLRASVEQPAQVTEPSAQEQPDPDAPPTFEDIPNLPELIEENGLRDIALRTHPAIADAVKLSKEASNLQELTKTEWLLANPSTKEGLTARKELLSKVKLPRTLAIKTWEGLTIAEREILSTTSLRDRGTKFGGWRQGFDMEYYWGMMEDTVGLPFIQFFRRVKNLSSIASDSAQQSMKKISEVADFRKIIRDPKLDLRVVELINSRNPENKMQPPANLTPQEIALADAYEAGYAERAPKIMFMRVLEIASTIEAFEKEFPKAVKDGKHSELEMGLILKEAGDRTALWDFLQNKTWGIYESGYYPFMLANPSLRESSTKLSTTRGKARFMERQVTYLDASEKMSRNSFQTYKTYLEQVDAQFLLMSEMETLSDMWDIVGGKFSNMDAIEGGIKDWTARLQGIPVKLNWYDRLFMNYQAQGFKAVFLEPALAIRNMFQQWLLHPDRSELFRVLIDPIPSDVRELGKLYYQKFVGEELGVRQELLHYDEGWNFLSPFNALAEKVTFYGWSDYITRYHSYIASLNKVQRATNQYIKDGDVKKWLSDSGAIHLNQNERNYVLTHYLSQLDNSFDLAIDGLNAVSGANMANFYIAQRISDMTNFAYKRSMRGIIEMGNLGRSFWSLIVYPRGYAQRMFFQAGKVLNVFDGKSTWEEARSGFNDIMGIAIAAEIFGAVWQKATRTKRNPYDPFNILLSWQAGGLAVGLAADLTELTINLAASTGIQGDEAKEVALNKLPALLTNVAETQIPFYRRTIDILDTALKVEGVDKFWIRKARALIDKDYTPEQLDQIDRDAWGMMLKGVMGVKTLDPLQFESMQSTLNESEVFLKEAANGIRQLDGSTMNIRDFGNQVASLTKPFPDYMITKDNGFSDLVLFYMECQETFREYELLPATPSTIRTNWRLAHPEEEAMLIIWGKMQKSVFEENSPQWKEVSKLVQIWSAKYGISRGMLPKFIGY